MKIVTGYTGQPHITSNAQQGFNQGIFGSGDCVLKVGNKFSAAMTDANTVTIQDGEGVMQGVHFRIDPGTTETVNISNGTSGYKRIDLVCARYTKNAITGVEDVSLVVVEGTPDASTPSTPTVNSGTILTGGSPVDFPLYKVSLDGLTPTLTALFDPNGAVINPPDFSDITLKDGWNQSSSPVTLTIQDTGWYEFFAYNTDSSSQLLLTISDEYYRTLFSMRNPYSSTDAEVTSGWLYLKAGMVIHVTFVATGNCKMYYAPSL